MKINWHQNPLKTTIDVDNQDKQMILLALQNEQYSEILCSIDNWLQRKTRKDAEPTIEKIHEKIREWGEICNMTADHEDVQIVIEDLQHGHGGDCTCWPMACSKCMAESFLGIDTIKGLGKHEAAKIMSAFGKNGDKTIDEALEALKTPYDYEKRHSSWEKYSREEYEKHIPRWEVEKKKAIEWLEKYKQEHGF
jgi:hypothetical protein